MSGDGFSRRYTVVAETRRRWGDAEKQAIVAEAAPPGTNISAVARRHGISRAFYSAGGGWHCQNNCKAPTLDEEVERLCGTELAPFGKGGGTVQLKIFAAAEMALLIEMIVYG